MMLLEGQARSEDLYVWAVKRSSGCGLTAPLSCLALADNPPPTPFLFHMDRCPFSTQLWGHFGEEIPLARRC